MVPSAFDKGSLKLGDDYDEIESEDFSEKDSQK
jgi:hypothetical protein